MYRRGFRNIARILLRLLQGEKFKSLDEIEKYNQAKGEDFQISYLKDAFVRAMNKERKRLAIKNISYEL